MEDELIMIILNQIIDILLYVAVFPVVLWLRKIYAKDKEPESRGFLRSLVISGVFSSFLAVALEYIGSNILDYRIEENNFLKLALDNYIVVGISEELSKYIFLYNKTWNSREFNYTFDGTIYGLSVSLGFALIENIQYVFSYGIATGISRAIMSIPGHAAFGVMMGSWYGLSKKYDANQQYTKSILCKFFSLIIPILMHGTYDLLLTIGTGLTNIFALLLVAVCYLILSKMTTELSENDEPITYGLKG